MIRTLRRSALTVIAAVVLAGSLPGSAGAQSTATPAPRVDALDVAARLVGLLEYSLRHAADHPWGPSAGGHALPPDLDPPLANATESKSRAYDDGCHAMPAVTEATGCDYGMIDSPVTVVILGDSHGAMWLPAMEQVAAHRGWRIHLLTKSACTPANITVMRHDAPYKKCDAWRKSAFEVIRKLQPDMVIVASTSEYDLKGKPYDPTSASYFETWRAGVADTLRIVGKSAGQVVLLNDVPKHTQDPIACLTQHPDDVTACATPRDIAMRPQMVEAYRGAAEDAGATFVDPTPLVCPGDPCPVVDGKYLVVYDNSHLTSVYAQHISDAFEALLPEIPTP